MKGKFLGLMLLVFGCTTTGTTEKTSNLEVGTCLKLTEAHLATIKNEQQRSVSGFYIIQIKDVGSSFYTAEVTIFGNPMDVVAVPIKSLEEITEKTNCETFNPTPVQ